jgi:hypothetical protein
MGEPFYAFDNGNSAASGQARQRRGQFVFQPAALYVGRLPGAHQFFLRDRFPFQGFGRW